MAIRRSGLQKDVLALYRRALRLIPTKPADTQHKFYAYIRYTFHQNARNISPRDIHAIEHLMRVGKRQIEHLETNSVKDCWIAKEAQNWISKYPGRHRMYTTLAQKLGGDNKISN
ncbi:heat shock [Pyrrhoderma noxium]|uniref:Heat shock n=1 Tax=Pyrrhoderma noxium TaxID=2282107 RepID=A0A286UCA8_9AGAM|nr:heat shock [Pyrrhoderma noxium]